MKYLTQLMIPATLFCFLLAGCSQEPPTSQPVPDSEAQTGATTPADSAPPETTTPTGDPPSGEVVDGFGTIRGVLKSPYARTGEGLVFVADLQVSLSDSATNPVVDQKNKIFVPHVLAVLAGSTVDFPNTDDVRHSVYSRKESTTSFNLGQYDAGVVKQVEFNEVGVTQLACNIHTEMSAYVIALSSPYFALTDRRGNFQIENVPAGPRKLTFFHERIEPTTIEVNVQPGQVIEVEFTDLKRRR